MPRWEPDARTRLVEAALAVYDERGFENATVDEIARRAGLTKRTFFRYFADKREALFGGGENVNELLVQGVRHAPADLGPLEAVGVGVGELAAAFDRQGEAGRHLVRIIRASPELWERQLIKFAVMAERIAETLHERGVRDPAAILAAESGVTALRVATGQWIQEGNMTSLQRLVHRTLADLRGIAGPVAQ